MSILAQNDIRKKIEDVVMEGPNNLGKIFDRHIEFEFDRQGADATMTTMTEDLCVYHVPTLTGGAVIREE